MFRSFGTLLDVCAVLQRTPGVDVHGGRGRNDHRFFYARTLGNAA